MGKHEEMKFKFGKFKIFWEFLPKICEDILDFQEDFYLHMLLLKQHLLELSLPVSFSNSANIWEF